MTFSLLLIFRFRNRKDKKEKEKMEKNIAYHSTSKYLRQIMGFQKGTRKSDLTTGKFWFTFIPGVIFKLIDKIKKKRIIYKRHKFVCIKFFTTSDLKFSLFFCEKIKTCWDFFFEMLNYDQPSFFYNPIPCNIFLYFTFMSVISSSLALWKTNCICNFYYSHI